MKYLFLSFSFLTCNLLISLCISKLILGVPTEDEMESIVRKLNFSRLGNITWLKLFGFFLSVYWNDMEDPILEYFHWQFLSYQIPNGSHHKVHFILNYCDITRYQELVFQKVSVNLKWRFTKLEKKQTVYLLGHWEFSKPVVLAEPLILVGSSV